MVFLINTHMGVSFFSLIKLISFHSFSHIRFTSLFVFTILMNSIKYGDISRPLIEGIFVFSHFWP